MRKRIATLVLSAAVSSFGFVAAAPPAAASCQTNPDVGDWCKVQEVLCINAYKVWEKLTGNC